MEKIRGIKQRVFSLFESESRFLHFVMGLFLLIALVLFAVIISWRIFFEDNILGGIVINIATDFLFLAISIGVLNVFLIKRRDSEWQDVKAKIIEKIANNTSGLLVVLLHLWVPADKRDVHTVLSELPTSNEPILREDIGEHLGQSIYDFDNNNVDQNNNVASRSMGYYNMENYLETFQTNRKHLHDVRTEYPRFVEAKLATALMGLEDASDALSFFFEVILLRTDFSCYKKLLKADEISELEKDVSEAEKAAIEAFLLEYIDPQVRNALRAIQEIEECGIEISIPFVPRKESTLMRFEYVLTDMYPLRY